jgi:hypothetical protein
VRAERARTRPRLRRLLLCCGLLAVVALSAVLWIAIRGVQARDHLLAAVPVLLATPRAVLESDTAGAVDGLDAARNDLLAARDLTSDPIWRAAEFVPLLGRDLRAVRQSADVLGEAAETVIPGVRLAVSEFPVDSFALDDGRIDLERLEGVSSAIAPIRSALDSVAGRAHLIATTTTVPEVSAAAAELVGRLGGAARALDELDDLLALAPGMLGQSGPREYLVLSLNNAEVRAVGGIPGALSVIRVDDGRISLAAQSPGSAMGERSDPVLPLTAAEEALYRPLLGEFMQDVTLTPDFARTGQLASAMWAEHTGQAVDGVISVDPVALGYMLRGLEPIPVSGYEVTADNAAELLLSTVYRTFDDPREQDAFFAGVTAGVVASVTSGSTPLDGMVRGAVRAAGEGRIRIWSADSEEQAVLAPLGIAGALPSSSAQSSAIGVYFNDATGAKMDYYLRAAVEVAVGQCRADGRPLIRVAVRVASTAPADAATSLPRYVTGGGRYGVAPGDTKTNVYVYAPPGSLAFGVTVDGEQYAFASAEHEGRSAAGVPVLLQPGRAATVAFWFLAPTGTATDTTVEHTPLVAPVEVTLGRVLDCAGLVLGPGVDS